MPRRRDGGSALEPRLPGDAAGVKKDEADADEASLVHCRPAAGRVALALSELVTSAATFSHSSMPSSAGLMWTPRRFHLPPAPPPLLEPRSEGNLMPRLTLSFSRLAHRSSSAGLAAASPPAAGAVVAPAAAKEDDGLVRLLHSGSTLPLRVRWWGSSLNSEAES